MANLWRATMEENGERHVEPLDDCVEHELDGLQCWCGPYVEDGVIVHNAWDGRKFKEMS